MLPEPGCKLLCCLICFELYFQAGAGAKGELVPQVADEGGDGEEVALVQLLEGPSQDMVPQGDREAVN